MNKEEELAGISKAILEILRDTREFTLEQAPDVIQQMLGWETCLNIIGIIITVILFTVSFIAYKKYKKDATEGALIVAVVTPIVGFLFLIISSINLAMVTLYPKAYLIEKLLQ